MSDDLGLIGGVYPKERNANAPDWVITNCNINIPQFREYVTKWQEQNPNEQWLNMELLISKGGKPYAKLREDKQDKEKIPF